MVDNECPLAMDVQMALMTDIFSDPEEIKVVKGLYGQDAQSFIDMIDRVLSHPFFSEDCMH